MSLQTEAAAPRQFRRDPNSLRRLLGSNRVKFGAVFVVINLHTLSELSLPLYLAVYVPVTAIVVVQFVFRFRFERPPIVLGPYVAWLGVAAFGFLVSLLLISPAGSAQGLVRFLFSAPLFLAFVLYTDGIGQLRDHVKTMVGFFAVASLSIPLQFLIGPVSWFATSSERAGLERYSSLVGNLTSIGIVVGLYVVLSDTFSRRIQWLFLAAMIVPAILSLQKSAVANIAIAALILVVLNWRRWRVIVAAVVASAVLAGAAYAFVPFLRDRLVASLLSFGLIPSGDVYRDDVGFLASMWDRLVVLPAANFAGLGDLHSAAAYATGGGYGMANTALVPAADALAPMAHNQFAELLTAFGPLFGTLLIAIMILIAVLLVRKSASTRNRLIVAVTAAYGLFLVNSLFANGTVYQPASASVFFLAMFVATSRLIGDGSRTVAVVHGAVDGGGQV